MDYKITFPGVEDGGFITCARNKKRSKNIPWLLKIILIGYDPYFGGKTPIVFRGPWGPMDQGGYLAIKPRGDHLTMQSVQAVENGWHAR